MDDSDFKRKRRKRNSTIYEHYSENEDGSFTCLVCFRRVHVSMGSSSNLHRHFKMHVRIDSDKESSSSPNVSMPIKIELDQLNSSFLDSFKTTHATSYPTSLQDILLKMTPEIVVFGSIVQDLISYTKVFPRPGESVRGTGFLAGSGGKGANQAVAAARLSQSGGNVAMIGRVGNDIFGTANRNSLESAGVDNSCVDSVDNANTATATITVVEQGENSIVVVLGANEHMTADVARQHQEIIASTKILLCQNEIPQEGSREAFVIAKKNNVTTFFNPAPGNASLDRSILKLVDIVCTNENEAEFLTDINADTMEGAIQAAEQMLKMGPHTAIITLGGKGGILAQKDKSTVIIKTPKVAAVDTTGAGDCFCGSFVHFYILGFSAEESAKRAAFIAAQAVCQRGTQTSYRTRDDLLKVNQGIFETNDFNIC